MQPSALRDASWVGDAVLGLCAREWIIAQGTSLTRPRHDLFRDLTSNAFLASFGPPTHVEAQLGSLYQREGLAAARAWFESNLIPVFLRQERNRHPARR